MKCLNDPAYVQGPQPSRVISIEGAPRALVLHDSSPWPGRIFTPLGKRVLSTMTTPNFGCECITAALFRALHTRHQDDTPGIYLLIAEPSITLISA